MSAAKIQLSGGAFQDALGNVVANGYMIMQLSQDAQVTGSSPEVQITAGRTIKVLLDASGNIKASPAQYAWPNDVLTPANTYYIVSVYTAAGQLVWGPNAQQILSSPSPFDVGQGFSPARVNINSAAVVTYDIGVFFPGQLISNQLLLLLPVERQVNFAVNLAPSVSACGTNPTASVTLTLNRNGTQFATLIVNTSGVGTFSSTATTFNAGDVLTITGPSSVDATYADIGITLSGTTTASNT